MKYQAIVCFMVMIAYPGFVHKIKKGSTNLLSLAHLFARHQMIATSGGEEVRE
jgi:hypothetical protein